jgi:asparagine synthetase B (glutamine-hydrolysing)
MSDATGRWVISFNGEIYSHGALRSELESLGCVFQTSSDTEVLINVLAHWGEAGLRKLARHVCLCAVGFPASTAMACPRSLRH